MCSGVGSDCTKADDDDSGGGGCASATVAAMTVAEDIQLDVLRQARIDLAAALRAAALHGFNEGIDNHFSYAVPGSDDKPAT